MRARLRGEPHLPGGATTMTDELTFYRHVIRAYRHCFAEIMDIVNGSSSFVARDVMQRLREAEKRLDKLWIMAPESLQDSATLRERKRLVALEEWR
jgi:hypothetical protein